jgi:hypothetical protein
MPGFEMLDSAKSEQLSGNTQRDPGNTADNRLNNPPERFGNFEDPRDERIDTGDSSDDIDEIVDDVEEIDDTVEADDNQDDQRGPVHTVKVNGVEQKVSYDELRNGYQRLQDYTAKTTQLARDRQAFEGTVQQVSTERQQYAYLVNALGERLQQIQGDEPDWNRLITEDPTGYLQKREQWNQRQRQIDAAKADSARLQQEQMEGYRQQMGAFVQYHHQKLLEAKPELAEAEKGRAFVTSISQYAQNEYGFSEPEISSIVDHRLLLIAEKAMRYDNLVKSGKIRGKKVQSRPPLKPGGAQSTNAGQRQVRNAKERLSRSGSVRDAADAIESIMANPRRGRR